MSIQLNLRMNDTLFDKAKKHANNFGYENIQDYIRELIREDVYEEDKLTKKEIVLAKKIEKLCDDNNLYGSFDDWKKLIEKKQKDEEKIRGDNI